MKYTFLLCLLFSVFQADAQQEVPYFKRVTHPFMPPITSEYFFFTQDGSMWFSTAQGLTSFDGSDIVYHSTLQQSTSLGLSKISAMAEDRQHNLYLAGTLGLYYFDRTTKEFIPIITGLPDTKHREALYMASLFIDDDGKIFAGSIFHGLFIYNPMNRQTVHFNLDPGKSDNWEDRQFNTVSSFAKHFTDTNKIWIGTFHGIYLFDKKEKKLSQNFEIISDLTHKYNQNINDRRTIDVSFMDVANDSIIWFNSWAGGFTKYNARTGKADIVFGRDALYKAKDVYYGYIIPRFIKLSEGKYLLGIYNGKTAIYDTRTKEATYFTVTQNEYAEEETRYVSRGPKGNIWIMQRGNLYVSMPANRKLQTIKVPNLTAVGFSKPKIRGVYFDSSSNLFYCGFLSASGVHVYDSNFVQQRVIPTSVINNYYTLGSVNDSKITKDGSGRFWVTGWKIHIMLPGEKKFTPIEKKFPALKWLGKEDQFSDITTSRSGNVLIKNKNGVIYQVNHTSLAVDSIICPEINATAVEIKSASTWYDDKRDLVYLTRKEGIAQYNLGKKMMRIIPHTSLFGNLSSFKGVCAPALDADKRIWFLMPRNGIRIINPVTLSCIDSINFGSNGLMRGDYSAIIGGPENYMAFRSQNGIVVYDYKKKESFLFDNSNGLSSPDNKSFLYANGYLFVGQSSRFEYFKFSNLNDFTSTITPYLNTVSFDSLNVFTRTSLEKGQPIRLPYNYNTLTFSFSAPEFIFPERIEYAYQLYPVEKNWQYANFFNRRINYSNLAPGQYVFKLKAEYQGGNWDAVPQEYILIIVPAWWQTKWFKALVALASIFIIPWLVRFRIKQVRRNEQQKLVQEKKLLELEAKALQAQMNPHCIFNSLNSIKALINKNENDHAAAYLTTFSKLIRTLFQNSDKREITLSEELETCKLYTRLEKMRFGNKIEFTFDVDKSVHLKDIKIPALILQPFIENAIWHGLIPKETGGKVIVTVKEKGDSIECMIDDNGIGRELSKQYKAQYKATHESKGIGLTQSRLELDKLLNEREDTLKIIDKKDEKGLALGTTVIITFKENK